MKKKSKISVAIICLIILVVAGFLVYKIPYNKAKSDFATAVKERKLENQKLDKSIASAEKAVHSKIKPYDPNTLKQLKRSITLAKKAKKEIPSAPKSTKKIKKLTKQLKVSFNYSEAENALAQAQENVKNSIKRMKQITNPSEKFVLARLKDVSDITDAKAVTEGNDPNGQLHKQGGYTSAIYFASSKVNQAEVNGEDVIEKGTSAGGGIEVYKTAADAKKREKYLANFDNSFIDPGYHTVVGTLVVRTSDKLNATDQKELAQQVINALIKIK